MPVCGERGTGQRTEAGNTRNTATHAHEDFPTTPDHADAPTLDLHRRRLRCAHLIAKGLVQHLEREALMPCRARMHRRDQKTYGGVGQRWGGQRSDASVAG